MGLLENIGSGQLILEPRVLAGLDELWERPLTTEGLDPPKPPVFLVPFLTPW